MVSQITPCERRQSPRPEWPKVQKSGICRSCFRFEDKNNAKCINVSQKWNIQIAIAQYTKVDEGERPRRLVTLRETATRLLRTARSRRETGPELML
jgi:hypothetical protein